ncbi:hypothetical protein AAG570_010143 [Ranatra chinensis]|uniref:Uncharacterized protein n=1 Tax=Ranatra chinensis TaxID=642074 RepID=A0ABD0YM44_9HEMI
MTVDRAFAYVAGSQKGWTVEVCQRDVKKLDDLPEKSVCSGWVPTGGVEGQRCGRGRGRPPARKQCPYWYWGKYPRWGTLDSGNVEVGVKSEFRPTTERQDTHEFCTGRMCGLAIPFRSFLDCGLVEALTNEHIVLMQIPRGTQHESGEKLSTSRNELQNSPIVEFFGTWELVCGGLETNPNNSVAVQKFSSCEPRRGGLNFDYLP